MDRLLRRILLVLALGALVFTALNAIAIHASGAALLAARSLWVSLVFAGFCALAVRRFSVASCFRLACIVFTLLTFEASLQALAWWGVLPGVATKEKCAFGRVYWAIEGRGNSIRNRDGWHFPEFDRGAAHRVAVIGDSFVEAVEVGRDHNEAALLNARLHQAKPGWAAFGLGSHGTSPAFHREVIDYAARHYHPEQVILCVYLGNDLAEMTPESCGLPGGSYIYYQWQSDGRLALDPASVANAQRFNEALEFSHQSLLLQTPIILRSHCLTIQAINSFQGALRRARQSRTRHEAANETDQIARETAALGNHAEVFLVPHTSQSEACHKLLKAELELCGRACAQHGIQMSLVTIPFFPAAFYRQPARTNWTGQLDRYDFLAPEAELGALARAHSWPFLGLGAQMRRDGLTTDVIRSFYHLDGVGHFTEAGHLYCANAIFAAFFAHTR